MQKKGRAPAGSKRWSKGRWCVKKAINLALDNEDIIELMRILLDEDPEGALEFLHKHFKGKARDLLEGGRKVMIEVPGAGTVKVSGNLFKK